MAGIIIKSVPVLFDLLTGCVLYKIAKKRYSDMVSFVVAGVILTAIGVYEPLVNFAGAGATVPLTGFGYSLANGVKKAVTEHGILGALMGGLEATAAGITASVFFGFLAALFFKPDDKT
jgi:stage V sporulation protein AE